MRTLVLLSILGLSAAVTPAEQGDCLVDSGEAVSDAMDASLFIWAASKRCVKTANEPIKCTVDIASAVKAVNGMINVILKAVDKCDGLHTANKACGLEAGKLSKHVAGLTAAAAIVAQKCPATAPAGGDGLGEIASPVMCTIDLKNTLKQLFKAIKHVRRSHDACQSSDPRDCAANALDVVSSFAGMGGYLAGAVGQCTRTTLFNKDAAKADTRKELCAQAANDLVHHTTEVAQSGVQLSQKCENTARLYENEQPQLYAQEGKVGTPSYVLGAFLPITAIVGFVGGRYYASNRATGEAREFMSDNELSIE